MDCSEQAGSSASPDPEFGRTHGKRAGFKAESQENDLMKLIFPVYSLYLARGKTERGAWRAETRGAKGEMREACWRLHEKETDLRCGNRG